MNEDVRVAVLIDCDNISWQLAKVIITETAKHGILSVKRAYGDWSNEYLRNWRTALQQLAIQPIQQPAYTVGKNATDTALIIDAMDLLYAGNIGTFCIVSSDSDFTRLAMRLRESGKRVYGIGEQKTPPSFCNACDRFTFTEVLTGQRLNTVENGATNSTRTATIGTSTSQAAEPASSSATRPLSATSTNGPGEPQIIGIKVPDIKELLIPAVRERARPDGWALLANVGGYIVNSEPSFDSRNYGYPKLGQLVSALTFLDSKDIPDQNGVLQRWVRLTEPQK